ncbi:MAG: tryptophan synthase subunit alpha [Myxococcaceae bacterium]|nr:tryptophan synthase subunit alpha [Myxococcaceae bacterium]
MSDRLQKCFAACKAQGRAALVTYLMGGDPSLDESEALTRACLESGADILELGMPFSDPIADGPVIQAAAERSLKAGTSLAQVLELAARLRKRSDAPIALMGYLNPVLSMGEGKFFEACEKAKVDAVIIPDLPPEEAGAFCAAAKKHGVATVFMLAPTSTPARVAAVRAAASGFIYYVTVTGVTGARRTMAQDAVENLKALRAGSPCPVVAGFGISSGEQARELGQHADGVVVGSALVARAAAPEPLSARVAAVSALVKDLRAGLAPR